MVFLAGRLLATAGNQIVSLYLAWRLYELTSSAWMLGLFGLLQFLSSLAMFLPAGDAADRHDRRRVLVAVMAAQGALCLLLLSADAMGQLGAGLVMVAGVVLGVARPFQMTAQQALPPQLVPPALLPRALSLGSAGSQAMFIAGPALGGVALLWFWRSCCSWRQRPCMPACDWRPRLPGRLHARCPACWRASATSAASRPSSAP
jgi:MFS family permease